MPKVELHCHLLGVISPSLLARIQRQSGKTLVDPSELEKLLPLKDLETFQRWFDMLKPYQSAPSEVMRPILESHIASVRQQGVVYTEIMISPAMFPSGISEMVAACHRWREWSLEMEHGTIQIEFVMVIPRNLSSESLERDTTSVLELHRQGLIVGVALVGPERGESLERFGRSFARWQDAGLGVEVHAGEHSGPRAVWDAIFHTNPQRLGHAISAFDDPALVEHIRSTSIHLEFCLTSNLRTSAVKQLDEHPIRRAHRLGMSFSLNTDDPGAFGCSMTSEYQLASTQFGFNESDFGEIFQNSLKARFSKALRHM